MTADTYTSALAVTKIATGSYDDTWGEVQNDETIQLFDDAITGQGAISIGTSVVFNLPPISNGATAQSRFFSMIFTGTPAGAVKIVMPASVNFKFYLIDNETGQPLTFDYGSSPDTVTVQTGEKRLIWCDGVSTWDVLAQATNSTTLNGIPAANWARQSRTAAEVTAGTIVNNNFDIANGNTFVVVTELPTTIIDASTGDCQQLTLTGNRVMAAPTNPIDGQDMDLLVIQDGTGSRTLTWNAVFLFEGGVPPTLSTAGGAIDRFLCRYSANLAKWICAHFSGIAAGSGASSLLTVAANTTGFNLIAALGFTPVVATAVTVIVNTGVVIQSVNPGTPAADLSGLPAGSTVNLVNGGYIIGCGGDGADGAQVGFPGSGVTAISASFAGNGGNAIVGPGASNSFNITNANGRIWGGGGGGGGAGAEASVSGGGSIIGNAGGAGGGAGGGRGGKGGRIQLSASSQRAGDGLPGGAGPAGAGGTAGSPVTAGGSCGVSGVGGTYGVNGTDGTAASLSGAAVASFSTGGVAGKAIELLGASAPTFISGSGSPNVLGLVS